VTAVESRLAGWLDAHLEAEGPWTLEPLAGGNSNDTALLRAGGRRFVLRRPPLHSLDRTAHSVAREFRVLTALRDTDVPVPSAVAVCEDPAVAGRPFLVMEHVPDAVSITDTAPPGWPTDPSAWTATADALVDALAALHTLDWEAAGLAGLGRPAGFLRRQPERWLRHWRSSATRPLPAMERLAEWLSAHLPDPGPTGVLHGDFHLDNCLFSTRGARLAAVIDWELATVGDPLLDLGLLLAFWGERPHPSPGFARIQAVSRTAGAPPRDHLLDRYQAAVGRSIAGTVDWYRVLSLVKLAAVVEGAHGQYRTGLLDTPYARDLEQDVPALLDEACAVAGISVATGAS
jgi:aminoglycoside phosphotransferase (APT) family kinase protein